MAYQLGVDLGTTFTAAAVFRAGRAEIISLGNRSAAVPSVVFLREDETILTGDAANRRAVTEPDRVAREFKRRVGDPTPILLGGSPYSAEALMAKLLAWVVDKVTELEGGPPDRVAVSHPANWGPYKKDLLGQAVRIAGLTNVVTLTEPEAAAIYYATTERVDPGEVVAVYDLGGGTFDVAVLRRTPTGFEILGDPEGIERLGGIDFDEAVFAHVARSIGGKLTELDPDDPAAAAAVARLRQDCVEAKEALSSDVDVSIPVLLPNIQTEVRLTRAEFEAMIRPTLADTIGAMRRALTSAGVTPEQVSTVLLVGGSSRIPLVAQLVGAELGRPVAVDAHPKHSIALGAAIMAGLSHSGDATAVNPEGVEARATAAGEVVPEASAVGHGPGTETIPPGAAAASAPSAPGQAAPGVDGTPPPGGVAAEAPSAPGQAAPGVDGTVGAGASPQAGSPPPTVPGSPAAPPPPPPAAPPPGPPPGAGSEPTEVVPAARGGSRTPLVVGAGLVAVVAAVIVGTVLAGGGGDGEPVAATGTTVAGTTTAAPDTTAAPTTAAPAPTFAGGTPVPVECREVSEPFVCITDVRFEGDNLIVDFEPIGFTPSLAPSPGSPTAGTMHLHVFLSPVVAPENAGAQSPTPGSWVIWDDVRPFGGPHPVYAGVAGFTRAEIPDDATEVCVRVADHTHALVGEPDFATGNCAPLPA